MNKSLVWLICGLVLSLCRLAEARERLAVFFTVEGDAELAQNLAEVAIAELAASGERELVGARELDGRLREILQDRELADCLEEASCLAQVGDVAGVGAALVGSVRRQGDQLLLDVALTNTRTGASGVRASRAVEADTALLIAAVQSSVAEAARGRQPEATPEPRAPTPPTPRTATDPPPDRTARRLFEPIPPARHSASRTDTTTSPITYLAWGAAGLAVLSFAGAGVIGSSAQKAPQGNTRAEVQADLARRQDSARLANGLLVAGSVLLAASVAGFVWQWE
jgi:hypothetical protein